MFDIWGVSTYVWYIVLHMLICKYNDWDIGEYSIATWTQAIIFQIAVECYALSEYGNTPIHLLSV